LPNPQPLTCDEPAENKQVEDEADGDDQQRQQQQFKGVFCEQTVEQA